MTGYPSPPRDEDQAQQDRQRRHAQMLVGALGTLTSTVTLIEVQARELQRLNLVSEADIRRFAGLAEEINDLAEKFGAGDFLAELKPIIQDMRRVRAEPDPPDGAGSPKRGAA